MKIKEVATPTHLLPTMTVALNVLYHPSELLLCFLSQVLNKLIFLHQSKFFLDEFKKNLCDVHSAGNLSVYHQNSISSYAKCNKPFLLFQDEKNQIMTTNVWLNLVRQF